MNQTSAPPSSLVTENNYLRRDERKHSLGYWQFLREMWPYFMRFPVYFSTVVGSMLLLAAVGRALPFLFGYAIDEGILKHNRQVILWAAASYLALELARAGLGFLHSYLFIKMGNKILFELRSRLIRHVSSLPVSYFDRTPSGRIVTRLSIDVLALGDLFTEGLILIFTNALNILAILVAMLLISPRLTAATLLVGPILVWISLRLSHKIQDILRLAKLKLAAINAFVAESLAGIKVLQLYNSTDKSAMKFKTLISQYTSVQLQSTRLYALLWPVVSFSFAISLAVALYYGGILASEGMPVGAFIAFLMNVQDFFPPVRAILEKYQQFQNSLTGGERVFSLLREAPESSQSLLNSERLPGSSAERQRLQGHIEFREVSFGYSAESSPVLNKVSFSIQPGQSLALVGRTGSGKSTIISLLQRIYDGWSGQIEIDGVNIEQMGLRPLRARLAVVQQDPILFRGTIAQNISLFNSRIHREQIERAVDLCGCREMIEHHGGLAGRVEERGSNLSMGERQLLAFARALAYDPDILILDEATANIDSQTEALLQKATRQVSSGRTSIIVAHRLSTILDCDRIMVLDQGSVREFGSHAELMAQRGLYHSLYTNQFFAASPN